MRFDNVKKEIKMKKYIVAGFRKGAKDNSSYNLNVHLYNENELRKSFAWIEGDDGNNFRKDDYPIKVNDIIRIVNEKGRLQCENDDFFYVFKRV